jgi:hypothetical protein
VTSEFGAVNRESFKTRAALFEIASNNYKKLAASRKSDSEKPQRTNALFSAQAENSRGRSVIRQ